MAWGGARVWSFLRCGRASADPSAHPAPLPPMGTLPPRSLDPDCGCMPNGPPDPGSGPPRAEGPPGSVA